MELLFAGILAILIAAGGGYYLLVSRSAQRMGILESEADNARRIRLRRANGAVMILLALVMFGGMAAYDRQVMPPRWAALWLLIVLVLLVVIISLAMIDLRLTAKLRRKNIPR